MLSIFQSACDSDTNVEQSELKLVSQQALPKREAGDVNKIEQPTLASQSRKVISPGNIVVLALNVHDGRAVIKSAQGDMQVMQVGDVVQSTEATLVNIMNDRLVFEEIITRPSGLKAKETHWVYKAENGVSRVQILRQHAPKSESKPVRKTVIVNG